MIAAKKLNRKQVIDLILEDLESLSGSNDPEIKYAVDKNIEFFQAARSFPRYIRWLLTKYSKVDGHRVLELADFHLRNGLWEETLLDQLLDLEKKKIPDLISPLRDELLSEILSLAPQKDRPIVVMNIGSGGMETERRVAIELTKRSITQPVIFIGLDSSSAALNVARQNLQSVDKTFTRLEHLTPSVISEIRTSHPSKPIQFMMFVGDARNLKTYADAQSIDIIFHSKFHHHLSDSDKKQFDDLIQKIARCVIEFDDYRGAYLPILSILTSWRKPVLLNGAVFSSLRDPTCADIKNYAKEGWETKVYPLKGFLKIHRSGQTW